jgi:hypothetical protein
LDGAIGSAGSTVRPLELAREPLAQHQDHRERLSIIDATTKTHVARILQKLDLPDRVLAVIYPYENGVVHPRT